MKTGTIIAIAVLFVIGAFVGGWFIGSSGTDSAATAQSLGVDAGGPPGLSDEDRAAMQKMTQEERQEFMAEQGIEAPGGGMGRPNTTDGTGMRGGQIEGDVIELTDDTLTIALTDGGSQTVYVDEDTTIAFEQGVPATQITEDARVLLFGQPETDGVMTATMLIVTN